MFFWGLHHSFYDYGSFSTWNQEGSAINQLPCLVFFSQLNGAIEAPVIK